jgi:hypothetical protein
VLNRGFTDSNLNYTFSNVVNGTVDLVDGRYARFMPTTDANAFGGFTYTVTDNKSDHMTRDVNVRIIGTPTPVPGLCLTNIKIPYKEKPSILSARLPIAVHSHWLCIGGLLSRLNDIIKSQISQ